jgi:hypothetical protein
VFLRVLIANFVEKMQTVAHRLLRGSSLGFGLVGCVILVTGISNVASAEPPAKLDSSLPTAVESSDGAKPSQASSTEATGEACTTSNRRDRLCPWGRLSDGHGKLLRCLSLDESHSLPKTANGETGTRAPTATGASELPSEVTAIVNSVVFEGGTIPSAKQNFASSASDYQTCVTTHGGLRHGAAELRIRFHVDARGLARDASVSRRRFISVQAARCVSRIVDHHLVGSPTSKANVGTLLIQFTRISR